MDPHSEPSANEPVRDFVGYAGDPPDSKWPNGARLALNFVLNVEEGSEPSVTDGDGYTENRLTDSSMNLGTTRDLGAEGLFEYGSRAGFWRIHREFQRRALPITIFACALALERNPAITADETRQSQPSGANTGSTKWPALPNQLCSICAAAARLSKCWYSAASSSPDRD